VSGGRLDSAGAASREQAGREQAATRPARTHEHSQLASLLTFSVDGSGVCAHRLGLVTRCPRTGTRGRPRGGRSGSASRG
jgi:hypothetical protein